MILDRLENAEKHATLGAGVAAAFDYLRRTDFARLVDGRYDVQGDRIYAMVQRYQLKPVAEARWEAHRKYLDVQYVAEGTERMGWKLLCAGLTVREPYDSQTDVIFYDAAGELLVVPAGSFVVFGPNDIHAPGLAVEGQEPGNRVCKVVVKCRVD